MRTTASASMLTSLLLGGTLMSILSMSAANAEDAELEVVAPPHVVIMSAELMPGSKIDDKLDQWKSEGKILGSSGFSIATQPFHMKYAYVAIDFGRQDQAKLAADFREIGAYLALGSRKVEVSFVENASAPIEAILQGAVTPTYEKHLKAYTEGYVGEVAKIGDAKHPKTMERNSNSYPSKTPLDPEAMTRQMPISETNRDKADDMTTSEVTPVNDESKTSETETISRKAAGTNTQ